MWGLLKGWNVGEGPLLLTHMFEFPKYGEIPYAITMRTQNYAHYGNKTKKKKKFKFTAEIKCAPCG